MKIAYLIQAHKNWEQLALLVRVLKEDWNEIFIHVDAKAQFEEEEFKKLIPHIDVQFVHPRIKVYWGHDSQVHETLLLLQSAFQASEDLTRFILLSGQDLPIKTNDYIWRFFHNNHHEYMEYYKFPVEWWKYGGYDRVQIYNFLALLGPFWNKVNREIQMLLPFRRTPPLGGHLFGGGTWFNLTRGAVKFILQYVQTTDVLKEIKYTSGVDEIFFQSILVHNMPHFVDMCKCLDLRYADWQWHTSHPKTLGQSDFEKLQHSHRLFARKFDMSFDSEVITSVLQLLNKSEHLENK